LPDSFPGILQQAYGLFANGRENPLWSIPKIEGGPAWINSDRYEINAKAEGDASPEMMMGPMMQGLLEDRFKLKVHRESREVQVYALTVAKGGLKLKPFQEGSCTPSSDTPHVPGQPPVCKARTSSKGPNLLTVDGQGMTLDEFSGCIRGLRVPVATVLRMLAGGMTEQEILAEYPDLQVEDIRECLRFAAASAMEGELARPRPT
jgi:uncharacterized protein (TIGR03435 family)